MFEEGVSSWIKYKLEVGLVGYWELCESTYELKLTVLYINCTKTICHKISKLGLGVQVISFTAIFMRNREIVQALVYGSRCRFQWIT